MNDQFAQGFIMCTLSSIWLLCAITVWVMIDIKREVEVVEEDIPHVHVRSLPEKCAKFMHEYDESEWDAQMEEYPRNNAWVECMGVKYVRGN